MQMDGKVLFLIVKIQSLYLITGGRYSADELHIFTKDVLYMFMLDDIDTRLCLSHEMVDCGHNVEGLLRGVATRSGKAPAEPVMEYRLHTM